MQKTQNFPNDDVDDTGYKHVSQHYGNRVVEFSSGGKKKIESLNFENWCNGGGIKQCLNLTFKVNFLCQKSSESIIEECQFMSIFFVKDTF